MAKIVITSSGNSIVVAFNDYAAAVGSTKRSYNKDNLTTVDLLADKVGLYMSITHEDWLLTYDAAYAGSELFIVDSIAGVAPTSFSDLFDKITALR